MHIPDGFVAGSINVVTAVGSAGTVGVSLWRVRRSLEQQAFKIPLLATTAAFVFAAQMLNFPIGGGTSGHFLGAVTAAALLGPFDACIVMTLVLVIQCLFFADGGLTALGTNVLNMGIVGGLGGYVIMRGIRGILPAGRSGYVVSTALASWASVVVASSVCALELALSGTSPLKIALPAMAGTHAIIGIGEALIAAAVLTAVAVARPDVLPAWAQIKSADATSRRTGRIWTMISAGAAVALVLAIFLSPFASSSPDGLEKVAENHGFLQRAAGEEEQAWRWSVLPDYTLGVVKNERVSTSAAGLAGTILVFGAGFALIKLAGRRRGRTVDT
jgi:cobalt/nickel transport system permease protein